MAGGGDIPANALVVPQREASTTSLQCPKLTKTNYNTWVVIMESILDAQGLWEAVDPVTGEAVDANKNKLARAIIYQSLSENILLQVARSRNARDIWEALRVRFLGADRVQQARLQTLKRELDQLRMGENESIEDFAGKLSEFVTKFNSLGSTLEDVVIVKKLLDSVPDKYIAIVASIEQFADLETMTFEEAIGRLKAFEERIKGREGSVEKDSNLLFTRSEGSSKQQNRDDRYARGRGGNKYRGYNNRGRDDDSQQVEGGDDQGKPKDKDGDSRGRGRGFGRGRGYGRGDYKRNLRCYECGRTGHFAYECPDLKKNEEVTNMVQTEDDADPALF